MNVSLNPELEGYVRAKVEDGLYSSASEVVREALRLLRDQDLRREAELERIRAAVQRGLADEKAGRTHHGPTVMAEMEAMLLERIESQRQKDD